MNTLEINGIKSTRVRGLLISELPPIIRPQMRVLTEEIDGRDGEIVTELGYQAYDRSVKIGLKADHNIDNVIRYFNGSGEVIFSNEPDKVYDFRIINSISYERMIRFRTAEVVFRVQPYKHSALEDSADPAESGATIRNSGNVYSFPIYQVTGSGSVALSINGGDPVTMNLGSGATFVADCGDQNVRDTGGTLKNRSVTGGLERLKLEPGNNTITWTGNVSGLHINRLSMWI